MTKIIQIIELPSKVAVSKKHVYYILTTGNLFAMNKSNHEILQVFYKGERAKVGRPRLMQIGVLIMENQFALSLIVEGGAQLLLDPMTLQTFAAY